MGDQALIIIKGPMICFLHHLEERGSHLNEYQINTLKSLQRTLDCHVQFMHHNKLNTKKKKHNKLKRVEAQEIFFFFVCVCVCVCSGQRTEKQPRGSFLSLKRPNTKQVDTLY